MSRSSRLSRRLRRRRGLAGLEFAMAAPVLLLLLAGIADLVIWLRTWLQMQQTTSGIAQVITQYQSLYTSDFTKVFYPIAQAGAGSATLACSGGGMVVTGVTNSSGTAKASWQWTSGSCATSSYASGSTVSLPGGYVPPSGLSVVVVELFTTSPAYVFASGLMGTTGLSAIRTTNVVMPRSGSLPTLTSGTRPGS